MAGFFYKMNACNFTKTILQQKFFPGNLMKFSEQLLCGIHVNGCFYILQSVRKATWNHMIFPLAKEDKIFSW